MVLRASLEDDDDDNDVDHLLSLGIFTGEHKNASRRREIRMMKVERTEDMFGGEVRSGS